MSEALTQQDAVTALDGWAGEGIAVRVVGGGDELLSVFRGRLGQRTAEKHPAEFWPLLSGAEGGFEAVERPGIWLHPEAFEDAVMHTGGQVLELRQSGVTLNLRRTPHVPGEVFSWERIFDLEGVSFGPQPGPGDSDGG